MSHGPGMAARCAWSSLEATLGNIQLARALVEDGLQVFPNHPQVRGRGLHERGVGGVQIYYDNPFFGTPR
jgi:hypothetical protein